MSMVMAKRLREQRATLANEAKAILDTAEAEKRELTAEESKNFDAAHVKIDELRAQVERIEKHEQLEKELGESRGVQAGREDRKGGEHGAGDETRAKAEKEARVNTVFEKYLRQGEQELNPEERQILMERRAQSTSNSAGGYTIAPEFYNKLETALKAFGGMRQAATVISTETGATLPMPTANDTTQVGAILSENSSVSEQDITFGVVNIGAYMYSSKSILVSYQLLQDSAFDISSYIAEQLATRIGRIQNTHFTVGTGSSQPTGVVVGATAGPVGATGETTSVIYDDLVGLVHSIDPAYRQNGAKFMLADSTLLAIKKLKDSQGHPLWQPSLVASQPDTLLGFGIVVNQDVAAMAANAKSILFGDFSKYFIRDVKGVSVMRLNERYADNGQVGFIGWARADGNLLDAGTHPVKYFANSAT